MPKERSTEITEQIPIIEITAGKVVEETPTEIAFSSEGLGYEVSKKIDFLLERKGYDSNKLRLIHGEIKSQALGHRKDGICIYDGEKKNIDYSLKYDSQLDDGTKNEIVELLKSIPHVKIKI